MSGAIIECVPNFSEGTDAASRGSDCGRHARGWGAPAGLVDGRGPQPLGGDDCRRAGGGGGGRGAGRGQGRGADRPDTAAGGASAHRGGGRDSVCAGAGDQAGAVRDAGAAGGTGDLAAVRSAGVFLRGGGGAAGPGEPGRRAPGAVRGAAGTRWRRSRRGGPTWEGLGCIPRAAPAPWVRASSWLRTTSTSIRPMWPWRGRSPRRFAPRQAD